MFIKSVSRLAFSVSILGVLAAQGALAAVTPEQVWENWKAQAQATAYEIKATSERREGDRLIIEGAVMEMDRDGESVQISYGRIVFTDRGDGTVSVELPEEVPLIASLKDAGEMEGLISWSGLTLIASGSPDTMRHDTTADKFEFAASVASSDDESMPSFDISFGGEGMSGFFQTRGANGTVEDMDAEMAMKVFDVSFETGDDAEGVAFDISAQDMTFVGNMTAIGTLARYPDPEQFGEALRAGLTLRSKITMGKSEGGMFFEDEDGATSVDTVSESATIDMNFDAKGFEYVLGAKGIELNASGDSIPLPEVKITMSENTFGFRMPWAASEEQQDFSVLTRFVDLALPDDIWGMLDPLQNLPRDPATLIIDIAGKVKMLGDLFADPEEVEDFPGELHALDLRAVQIKMLGADMTGTGSFTFDNSDTETFDGFPRPTGSIDMHLVGGNALLDKAIAMGLVDSDEAMGYRMMLALFARPGEGKDTLVSKIEITEDGAILANGQRIQ